MDCHLCQGKGFFTWDTCPRLLYNDASISRALSFFNKWIQSHIYHMPGGSVASRVNYDLSWINGKSLYHQPVKLVRAFEFMHAAYLTIAAEGKDE